MKKLLIALPLLIATATTVEARPSCRYVGQAAQQIMTLRQNPKQIPMVYIIDRVKDSKPALSKGLIEEYVYASYLEKLELTNKKAQDAIYNFVQKYQRRCKQQRRIQELQSINL